MTTIRDPRPKRKTLPAPIRWLSFSTLLVMSMIWMAAPAAMAEDPPSDDPCSYEFDYPEGTPLVGVGTWLNDGAEESCTGEPLCVIYLPVSYGDGDCAAWPGNSGENSATFTECGENRFSYTQWTTLVCSGGEVPEGTRKTVYTDRCEPDVPDSLRSRIVDFSGCEESVKRTAAKVDAESADAAGNK